MSVVDTDTYILGTERAELFRLGLQHQVWAAEARQGWSLAGFGHGQNLLDLGCGPGFCTQDLAYMVGQQGSVIGVDRSEAFIDFANQTVGLHGLPVDFRAETFDQMGLAANSLDGAYCRWALAWISNPASVVEKVSAALKPGGVFVCQEYFHWETLQIEPALPAMTEAIAAARKSFGDAEGDIDIGRRLPQLFVAAGYLVESIRPMIKVARPGTLDWQWPNSFFEIYFPKVAEAGLMTAATCEQALKEWKTLEATPGALCNCPQMVEVIARKPRH